MKIAFVSQPTDPVFPPLDRSSIGIITVELARRLAKSNEVVGYIKGHGIRKKEIWEEGVNYRLIPVSFDNKFLLKILSRFSKFYNRKCPLFASWSYYLIYILQVAIDLRMQECDIVHIHSFSQFVPIIRSFNPHIKIVLHVHNEWMTNLDGTMIERRLRKTDFVVGCSEYITEKIRRRFPQYADRCQTVYNGVDINLFSRKHDKTSTKKDGTRRLLFVGRLSPEKGVHILLEAFGKICKIYPDIELEIVGGIGELKYEYIIGISDDDKERELASCYDKNSPGSYFIKLKELVPKNFENNLTFTGYIPQSQLVNHYVDSDVFILPSICQEAFGMAIIEAMACEVPVVATRVGGMAEIVEEGKCGLLVERGDSAKLAEAILRILLDDKLRESMGKAGRQRVLELFTWDRISENLLQKYLNIYD
jgi:glycosyltransferase involved in cell wall biosynthesis